MCMAFLYSSKDTLLVKYSCTTIKALLSVNVACLQELSGLGFLVHSFKLATQEEK